MERWFMDMQFRRLETALVNTCLPTEDGSSRLAQADEFMLMQIDSRDRVQFKHVDTRNYLYLNPDDSISIPVGSVFHLGFFDRVN